ncbi:PTPA-CTERM sorting domain-containing protein [Thermoleptolyngbya oregonensis NK1-22]|uniref:PTPA-CTERM sorting domain-containing protein n=1 Tax=Thermoleptolyngbya oregonensis NK1-22 TaxID=2547457 RepID=A0AA97BQ86_9CYAN|nr:PTPA-CTERM sorting domain-containing protein [Thermoleptolyngbya oregonensis NK1-22]
MFYQVPTPAMLPGLVGMGLAALKKRKEQNDQDNDSTV